jgi:hypothetical protein
MVPSEQASIRDIQFGFDNGMDERIIDDEIKLIPYYRKEEIYRCIVI